MIKFQAHKVINTETGASCKVYYWESSRQGKQGISVNAKDYGYELHEVMPGMAINNTDTMTDYFCKSSVFIPEGHELYPAALERYETNERAREARYARSMQKRQAKRESASAVFH